MAEFQWWLLLVGLVAGGGLVAVLYMDSARNEADIDEDELPAETAWITERLLAVGRTVDPVTVERVLVEHRSYRNEPPPDRLEPEALEWPTGTLPESATPISPDPDAAREAPGD